MTKNSLKLLHFADFHLGAGKTYGKIDPKTGLNQRIIDFLNSFDFLVNYAIEERVDLVVFAGDAYENRNPNITLQREFAKRIRQLTKKGIKVFLLVGNHDLPNIEKHAHSLAVFDALETEGVTIGRLPQIYLMETTFGPIQIAALPSFSKSQFLTEEKEPNGLDEMEKLSELEKIIAQKILFHLGEMSQKIKTEYPAILTAHVSLAEAILGSEQKMSIACSEPLLHSEALLKREFQYIALGHIHKQQVISSNEPPIIYAGSLDRVDFGEEREKKGFYLVEIIKENGNFKLKEMPQFIEVPCREFITLNIETASENPTEEILQAISKNGIDQKVVRVKIKVQTGQSDSIQLKEIRDALDRAFFLHSIEIETPEEIKKTRNPLLTQEKNPIDALKTWLNTQNLPEKRKNELLLCGKLLIEKYLLEKEQRE